MQYAHTLRCIDASLALKKHRSEVELLVIHIYTYTYTNNTKSEAQLKRHERQRRNNKVTKPCNEKEIRTLMRRRRGGLVFVSFRNSFFFLGGFLVCLISRTPRHNLRGRFSFRLSTTFVTNQVPASREEARSRNWIERARATSIRMQEFVYITLLCVTHDTKCTENVVKQHQQLFNGLYVLSTNSQTGISYFSLYYYLLFSFLFFIPFLLIFFFFYFFVLLDVMAFLPCVEVIPEHTDRAARIKQSRVKMMWLKAELNGKDREEKERESWRRVREYREKIEREREERD